MTESHEKQPPQSDEALQEQAGEQQAAPDQPAGQEPSDQNRPAAEELSLEEQLAAALAERDAMQESLLRCHADFDNFRKRVQREAEEFRRYQSLQLVRDLLPTLDNLRRALNAAEQSSNVEDLIQGVKLVAQEMEETFIRHSAVPIDSVGQPFDPNLHEAIQQVPSNEVPAMTVLNEVERGYRMHDRVVRPSKVIVSSGPAE